MVSLTELLCCADYNILHLSKFLKAWFWAPYVHFFIICSSITDSFVLFLKATQRKYIHTSCLWRPILISGIQGVSFDSYLSFKNQASKACNIAYCHLCNISEALDIFPLLTVRNFYMLFVSPRLDYYNTLLSSQNATARILTYYQNERSYFTGSLSFLLVTYIDFKIFFITFYTTLWSCPSLM